MKWITREKPKIDRIACPWLIKKFIDPEAEIIYAPTEKVKELAKKFNAIPFDIPDVEYTHYKDQCTFDYFLKKHELNDHALNILARIVRAADTDKHELASQSSGLWAISAGLAHNFSSDEELLEKGMLIYDALYSWAKFHLHEKHTESPIDRLFIEIYNKYLKQKPTRKPPRWVKDLKEIIQDQIDTNISLKQISKDLDINAAYISREFSKYFDDMSFGEYIRKLRIEKSIELLKNSNYALTEIAYLTGFSDQSHFARIFKKYTGMQPSLYRKKIRKK